MFNLPGDAVRRSRGIYTGAMEESHFNSSYFWPAVPTVSGQIDNSMFLNKVKEQLIQEKGCNLSTHYPTLLTVPTSMSMSLPAGISLDGENKVEIHGIPHSQASVTQNITVLPVPTTGLMTATGLVITSPSGSLVTTPSSSCQTFPISAPSTMIVSTLPGTQTLQVMSEIAKVKLPDVGDGGNQKSGRGRKKKRIPEPTLPELHDPYDLSNEDEDDHPKDGKTYRCRMCSITFFSKSEMQIHSKSHTEAKPHKCPHCSKTFANSSYLAQHVRIHSGAKPYTCSYCQKAFRQLSHLQQHTRIHTKVHSVVSKPHKCPYCSKSFANRSYLTQHVRIHSGVKPYNCRFCLKAFRQLSHLQQHTRIHMKVHSVVSKPHKCPHCSKTFANSSYLAQHLRIHSGAKPYNCRYCQKAFRQLSHLQQHTRIHTGDRPYKCVHPGCEKAFTQLSNLQSHRRQHNKDKPFKCHNCHRAYTDASALEVHLSTHTVKHAKVYTCSICSRAYTSETYLMKHMRKHNAPESQQPTQVMTSQSHFTPVSQAPTSEGPQCSFDMNPFKNDHHKDLCLTVSTSAIQVEHLSSS
ncbi:PREDICTED: zinc finger protein 384 isoform X2 [Nanorana parkeri]|uniref:zinc finger protein 384 isoform X2 n=1 Tax=Nanorana parkeri TaxID=125878 RepID=UPI0008540B10|nr:PREDICTED: zinc finger protein 384 isoform X2 [Nanorana parkeri]